MKRAAVGLALVVTLVLLASVPAVAQARDPFRPPAGAGPAPGSEAPAGPENGGVVEEPSSPGGLPRTGQDLVLPFAAALACIAAGGALRLTGRLLAV